MNNKKQLNIKKNKGKQSPTYRYQYQSHHLQQNIHLIQNKKKVIKI